MCSRNTQKSKQIVRHNDIESLTFNIFTDRTDLDFLFLTENKLKYVQIRPFLKHVVTIRLKKVTEYEQIPIISNCRQGGFRK